MTAPEPFHVSEYLKQAMESRGWGIEDVAIRMGPEADYAVNYLTLELTLTVRLVGAIVGRETAEAFARAFETSPEVWLNLDQSWRDAMKRLEN